MSNKQAFWSIIEHKDKIGSHFHVNCKGANGEIVFSSTSIFKTREEGDDLIQRGQKLSQIIENYEIKFDKNNKPYLVLKDGDDILFKTETYSKKNVAIDAVQTCVKVGKSTKIVFEPVK